MTKSNQFNQRAHNTSRLILDLLIINAADLYQNQHPSTWQYLLKIPLLQMLFSSDFFYFPVFLTEVRIAGATPCEPHPI